MRVPHPATTQAITIARQGASMSQKTSVFAYLISDHTIVVCKKPRNCRAEAHSPTYQNMPQAGGLTQKTHRKTCHGKELGGMHKIDAAPTHQETHETQADK